MRLLAILLLSITAAAELPDAPSATRTAPPPASYPDYSEHLTWRQSLTSKRFLIPEAVMAGSMAFDIHETLRGLHECPWLVEKNQYWWVGPRPTASQLITRDLTIFGIVTSVNLLASKYLSPWITIGPAAGFSARHVQGGVEWIQACH